MKLKGQPDTDRVEREQRVAESFHSGEMEGLRASAHARKDGRDYIAGRITSDDLVERARKRYGLTD